MDTRKCGLCFLLLLGSCGGNAIKETTAPPPAISVMVSPGTATVQAGAVSQFTATVQNDSQSKGVSWALSGAGCSGAGCGSLSASSSASGVAITYTAPGSVPSPATVTLTATSVTDNTKSAAATITITAVSGSISVTFSPKRGGIPVSQSLTFTATVTNDVGGAGVTWSATAGSFSSQTPTSAVYVAPSSGQVVSITATSNADSTKSASATIGVTDLAGITTFHNDLSRDGANSQEYALTTSGVATSTFGKLFSCTVDGAIYAQPLWVPGVSIAGVAHNVVFVATQSDSLYAFDADASPCKQLWHANLIDTAHGGASGEAPVPSGPSGYLVGSGSGDITPVVGVTGTPVIDLTTSTLYVVGKSYIKSSPPAFFQRLHAIDLDTGNEKFAGPKSIDNTISVPGNASDGTGTTVSFDPRDESQRAALALVNGAVYVSWASHEDKQPYHGWVIGFNAANLSVAGVFNDSPDGRQGGIWMAGGGPAADASHNLFLITGNGDYDGATDFGDSVLKLGTTSNTISLSDWFTPNDQANLDSWDLDLGSGGAVILIDVSSQHLLIGGGKQGNDNPGEIFVLNRDLLGHLDGTINQTDPQVVQKFSTGGEIFSTPAFWNNTLYVAPVGESLFSYAFDTSAGQFTTTSPGQSVAVFGFPGTTPSVSASGTTNGIVWVLDDSQYCTAQSPGCGPAVLHAYDATNLGSELWNSSKAPGSRDQAGNAVKFTVSTVANGKVYVGTRGSDNASGGIGELDVYGLFPN